MSKGIRSAALVIGGASLLLALSETAWGQAHFPYRPRNGGAYSEGQYGERPISGVEIELRSLRVQLPDEAHPDAQTSSEKLHLAFVLPGDYRPETQDIDIAIQGPKNYLLDRVKRTYTAGYNVFSWNAEVVQGLGISLDELEPRVCLTGDMYIPCLLAPTPPAGMPEVASCRALLETNIEGDLKFFLRDVGKLVVEGKHHATPGIPLEVVIPAGGTSHHSDLYVILEYEAEHGARSVRQCFPIQSLRAHVGSAVDH